ncbi:hypothetical protein HY488_00915 [Candidatus Woesearchaeota archaeon]|nr:hypothetical protein [Candidatus Woesearchaeota archaeon]
MISKHMRFFMRCFCHIFITATSRRASSSHQEN